MEPRRTNLILVVVWLGTLLLSVLPNIIFQEFLGGVPEWLLGAKLALIAVLLYATLLVQALRPLQRYFLVFLAIFVVELIWQWIAGQPDWLSWFPASGGFLLQMLGIQLRRLGAALLLIATLAIIGFSRKDFFFQLGDLAATSKPMPEVGVDKPSNWRSLGRRLCLFAFLALLAILALVNPPNLDRLERLAPLLPGILLIAAMNSFSEEVTYRAALLAPVHKLVGGLQAGLLTATYFGIAHYYGVPSGLLGVAATGFFGWILARSMLETRGLFWPWAIHAAGDVVIFSFLAMASF
jgi:membrane protease YdiL (CAAX protease family)